ncbi:hypothetical protein PTSG_05369 [Salpingoeca rosetta]|uniref:Uncharacterized protein n=1 Tax=Salpingoeca rosetta (strain ATCC 50818 / BSB-021) TaxID=946362 RepID=F2UA82_SALR5|nr:uncharacterized protein PTSG_05369 [Salpingoeca rosetta]EGD73657.1 hypothetical protein PTSG_05369 [Salpingoeca rosetta]|eukprot:XP_004993938.1 hypothetical protein PTSG_05369 [Salpingoeca rosetta]
MSLCRVARLVRLAAPARAMHAASAVRSVQGTGFSDKELAEETIYIRKHEAKIRQMKLKEKAEITKDREEILRLAKETKRPHVKELLEDLASHV